MYRQGQKGRERNKTEKALSHTKKRKIQKYQIGRQRQRQNGSKAVRQRERYGDKKAVYEPRRLKDR